MKTAEHDAARSSEIELVQWFRPAREAMDPDATFKQHAAEHRFQLSPISTVRELAPDAFDAESLLVVRRTADGEVPYEVFFVLPTEPSYEQYDAVAANRRPGHRFGYALD